MQFSHVLTIYDVLFIVGFNLSLIYVPKLRLDNIYTVTFDHYKCWIHEKKTLKMIALLRKIHTIPIGKDI